MSEEANTSLELTASHGTEPSQDGGVQATTAPSTSEQRVAHSRALNLNLSLDTVANGIVAQYVTAFSFPTHQDVRGWSPPDGLPYSTLAPHELYTLLFEAESMMAYPAPQPQGLPETAPDGGACFFADGPQYLSPAPDPHVLEQPPVYSEADVEMHSEPSACVVPVYQAPVSQAPQSPFFHSSEFHAVELRTPFFAEPVPVQARSFKVPYNYTSAAQPQRRPAPPRGGVAPALARSITNIRLARERATRLARNEARDSGRTSREKGVPSVLEGWSEPAVQEGRAQNAKEGHTEYPASMYIAPMDPPSRSWDYTCGS